MFLWQGAFFILTVFHRDHFIWLLLFLPIVAYLHHGIVALLQRSCYQTALTDLKFKIKAFAAALSLIGKMSFGNLLYLRTIHSFYIIRKMLHNQEDLDLLLHLEATVVTSSGHDYDGTVLLTRDTLFIVGQAADTIQQTLFIKDIDLQEDEEDNRSVAVVNQVVIAKDESEEADGVHDSGDPDRLRQFLKDARAQALEQMATLDSSDSNLTSPGQKFVLLVDPMLRRTLLLQFQSAKRNLISDP